MEHNLKFLQLNLGKSKAATNNLVSKYTEFKTNFILIQKPYIINNKLLGIPLCDTVYRSATGSRCAIIVRQNMFNFPHQIRTRSRSIAMYIS